MEPSSQNVSDILLMIDVVRVTVIECRCYTNLLTLCILALLIDGYKNGKLEIRFGLFVLKFAYGMKNSITRSLC